MSEREEVLTYFGWQTCVMGDECCHDECRIPVQMADEIVRLRSQLAAAQKELANRLDPLHPSWKNAPIEKVLEGFTWLGDVNKALQEQNDELVMKLTTAERERDEARRERDEANECAVKQLKIIAEYSKMFRDEKDRAERAERVVEAARAAVADCSCGSMDLESAVRALDATPTPGDA